MVCLISYRLTSNRVSCEIGHWSSLPDLRAMQQNSPKIQMQGIWYVENAYDDLDNCNIADFDC